MTSWKIKMNSEMLTCYACYVLCVDDGSVVYYVLCDNCSVHMDMCCASACACANILAVVGWFFVGWCCGAITNYKLGFSLGFVALAGNPWHQKT